jgi:CheY-like chemotaxis protein
MSRILLADHSPHAQRMGERILRDEGFEVATVTDGETVLLRLKDLTPDLVLADISLPSRSGYEVCEYVKSSGKYPQTRVVLTAGPVAVFDEARAQAAGSDGFVRKPFEASMLLGVVQPLVEKPEQNAAPTREPAVESAKPAPLPQPASAPALPKPIDREQVRAAVILALEASLITMIENITEKVLVALEAEVQPAPAPVKVPPPVTKADSALPKPAPPAPVTKVGEPGPTPEEPVVRIRTPVFRTLS